MCAFGRWITGFNWACVYSLASTKDRFKLFYSIMQDAVERYLPYRKFRICSTDKPWVTSSKTLSARRQRAFIAQGKDSHAFRLLRNKVQREIGKWKSKYFNSKVSSLKDTNVSRWWTEIKSLSGQNSKSEWRYQLLDNDTLDTQVLEEKFNTNTFLLNLTSHFHPLSGDVLTDPTPVLA